MTLLPQEKAQQCMVEAEKLDEDPTAMEKYRFAQKRSEEPSNFRL